MTCAHGRSDGMVVHICGPEAEGSAVVRGRTWRWDFHDYLGPCFVDAKGNPLKRQPTERNPVWDAFAVWLENYRATKAARTPARR